MPPSIASTGDNPLISVIVPAYNAATTAYRAVNSAITQTYGNLEVIVVDDGSTDELSTALQAHLDTIQLIRQPNKGAGHARNTGAFHAKGEFLAFLDADDYWHPKKLERQLEVYRRHPETTLCGTQSHPPLSAVPEMRRALGTSREEIIYVRDFSRFFLNPYIGTPGVMLRRQLFMDLGGFRTDLTSAEDIDLWLRAAFSGVVALVPEPLFTITPSPSSLTAQHKDGTYQDNLRVIDDFCQSHPNFAQSHKDLVRQAKARVLTNWGSDALARGDHQRAHAILSRSLSFRFSSRALFLFLKTLILRSARRR